MKIGITKNTTIYGRKHRFVVWIPEQGTKDFKTQSGARRFANKMGRLLKLEVKDETK